MIRSVLIRTRYEWSFAALDKVIVPRQQPLIERALMVWACLCWHLRLVFLLFVLISLFWILSSSLSSSFLSDLQTGELGKPSPSELIIERLGMREGYVSERLVLVLRTRLKVLWNCRKGQADPRLTQTVVCWGLRSKSLFVNFRHF